ncbi:hypothetical protein SUGI_0818440 [Cryptomeria japonica]|nr:hypothetical protein SUGI_0818440 [Cryptomeria japonica]
MDYRESANIKQQHTLDEENNARQGRLPFSVDLNQATTNEVHIIDGAICESQPSALNDIPTQTFQQTIPLYMINKTLEKRGSDDILMEDHDQHSYG